MHRLLFAALMLVGTSPAVWLAWLAGHGQLGADPLNRLLSDTGHWALGWLLVTLSVTPVRRFSTWTARRLSLRRGRRMADWNGLIRHRRTMGLWAFAYASAHLLLYALLDASDWSAFWMDIGEKTYLQMGLMAWVALLPLAVTSNQRAIRLLKKNWARLHRLAYLAALLSVTHIVWQAKAGDHAHLPWVAAAVLVAAMRAVAWRMGDKGPARVAER